MKDRIAHVLAPYTDSGGGIRWPNAEEERHALASRLFGACLIAAIDNWLDLAIDQLRNPVPSAERARAITDQHKDKSRRDVFSSLNAAQRAAVESLLFETVQGTMFSALVKMDQFPGGNLDLLVADSESRAPLASVVEGDILDLHERLLVWAEEFSDYAKELETA